MSLPLLLALDLHEVISILVGATLLVSWVLRQIGDAKKKMAVPGGAAQAQRPQLGRPPEAVPGGAAGDPLRAQVDEFLRRVQQARDPGQAGPAPARAGGARDDIQILLEEANVPDRRAPVDRSRPVVKSGTLPRTGKSPVVPRQPPRERKPRPPQRAIEPRQQTVAEQVARRVGAATQQMQDEVSNLGERVKKADADFDAQLHHKFDHELGGLAARHASRVLAQDSVLSAPSPATQIAALLASADGIRQAILLNEVLRRPEERW